MTILVLNIGSTSLKYKIFSAEKDNLLLLKENSFSDIGQKIKSHSRAFEMLVREIGSFSPEVIVHRVVHGGTKFKKPILVDEKNLKKLANLNHLAPLHQPFNLEGIKLAKEYFPKIYNIACFDTSFFADLPEKAKIYGLPFKFYKKFGIQRFGFHGLSHEYVAYMAAKKLGQSLSKINLITCHLGGGASICAIKKGKAIDTSLGFTPIEGLLMTTRCGDIDPGIILYLNRNLGLSFKKIDRLLNKESGFFGLSGCKNFLELEEKVKKGDPGAKLAFEIYAYRIEKYIGAYLAILRKIDGLIFTGAIGFGSKMLRKKILQGLKFLKKIPILAIKTDEEKLMAQKVIDFVSENKVEHSETEV